MTPSRARPLLPVVDLALAGAMVVLVVVVGFQIEADGDERTMDAIGFGCAVAAAAVLALRTRLPEVMVAVVTAALAVYAARRYPGGPIYLAMPIALFSYALLRPRRLAYPVAAAVALVMVASAAIWGAQNAAVHLVISVGWATVAVLAADLVRARRDRQEAADRLAEDQALRHLAEERVRIAQDLHDSVAHAMATINVQSGVAAHLIDRQPGQARDALEAIRVASADVLDELGAILGVLRANDDVPRHSRPDLDAIDDLVDRARLNGLRVELVDAAGRAVADVPGPVRAAAYRVAQEGLTNVMRHAPAAAAMVEVTAAAGGGLTVAVTDDGNGAPASADGAGFGLVGMRERVEATGGRLEAGPTRAGGFSVRATWPGPGGDG